MRYRFLLLFLVFGLVTHAQVPGYMGKRFAVGYSNYFMLSLIGPTANVESASGSVGVNSTHCFNLEYTVRNRTNFCFSVQKARTGMQPKESALTVYNDVSSYDSYSVNYEPKPYKPMQIDMLNIGIGLKFFESGSLAPIGKYKKLEFLLLFNHLTYKKNNFTYYNYNYGKKVSLSKGSGDYNFNSFAITYTLGRSRVLFDRIVLDYGIRFGLVPAGVWSFLKENDVLPYSSTTTSNGNPVISAEEQFRYANNYRIFRYQTFNFHIGLGFLAF